LNVLAAAARNLVFGRSVTLDCVDLETGQDRQFRLDRIKQASVMEAQPPS